MSKAVHENLPQISQVRYKGIFDFEQLYRIMRAWFAEREYEFFETKYKDKDKTLGHEIEISWDGHREINDFAKNEISIYFHGWDMNEIEVIKDGKKKKVYKGRIKIDFKGTLLLDYQELWAKTAFHRWLRKMYINHVIYHEVDDIWSDKLWYEINKLQQLCKQYLEMESHSDVYDDMW